MFANLPLSANAGLFLVAALIVWRAGGRLARQADRLAERTGAGHEFLGLVMLGGITSLPEVAVAVTATLNGVPELSVNDVIGSASVNLLVLALADLFLGRDALTGTLASPAVLLQGALGIVVLSLVIGAVLAGDVAILGIGAWSWTLLAASMGSIWLVSRARGAQAWVPARKQGLNRDTMVQTADDEVDQSGGRLAAGIIASALFILAGGFLLAQSAEALAEQTGLGTSFFGAILLAASTSMPEVSTVLAAVRIRRYEMAIADVLGTNIFNVCIIALVDALHPGTPVIPVVGQFAAFAALLAIVLTVIYLAGMVERRNRTVLRIGYDSFAVLAVYVVGVVLLYQLR